MVYWEISNFVSLIKTEDMEKRKLKKLTEFELSQIRGGEWVIVKGE